MNLNNKKDSLKKWLAISVVLIIIVAILVIIVKKFVFKSDKAPNLLVGEISDIKECELGEEDFYIYVGGAYWGELNRDELKNFGLKTYEFSIGVIEGEKTVTNKYKGFNLSEWLVKSNIDDFQKISFTSKEQEILSLDIEQIRDTMYIVLYKNDEFMNDDYRAALVAYDSENKISFNNIMAIRFEKIEEETADSGHTNPNPNGSSEDNISSPAEEGLQENE